MSKIITLLLSIFMSLTIIAQDNFENYYYSWNGGTCIKQNSDSSYILTGWKYGDFGIMLMKIGPSGDSLWTNYLTNKGIGQHLLITDDSDYIITGNTNDASNNDFEIIKTDSSGSILWSKNYGGPNNDFVYHLDNTSDNGYVVVGSTESYGNGLNDVFIFKTNNLGDSLWSKTFGGSGHDFGSCVETTADSGLIIAGTTESYGAGLKDIWLIKTNINGDTLWTKTYGGLNDDLGQFVQQTQDLGYIIIGTSESFGIGIRNAYLIKTDTNGDTLWTKTYNGNSPAGSGQNKLSGMCVKQTIDNGFILLTSAEPTLIRTNSIGDTLWTRSYYGSSMAGPSFLAYHYDNNIQITNDNGYIFTGGTQTEFGEVIGNIVKTDSDGMITSISFVNSVNRNNIQIFPNPTTGVFYISEKDDLAIEIYNLHGETLFRTNESKVDISMYPNGIYFIKVTSNMEVSIRKIIKQ